MPRNFVLRCKPCYWPQKTSLIQGETAQEACPWGKGGLLVALAFPG
ncbi:MAG: hypothetical protein R6U55_05600 [Desulfovermiculus sp.]